MNTVALSSVGTNVAYDVTHIRVDQTGGYSFFSQSLAPLVETGFENADAGSYSVVVTGLGGGAASIVDAAAVVPEPATVALFGLGLVGVAALRRRA